MSRFTVKTKTTSVEGVDAHYCAGGLDYYVLVADSSGEVHELGVISPGRNQSVPQIIKAKGFNPDQALWERIGWRRS